MQNTTTGQNTFAPALLGFANTSTYTGFCRSRLYALIARGEFPAPLKIGKSSRWVRAEIDAWLSEQIAARGSKGGAA
jgi:predicted DNA-binding transcriptional regulator AlpA